jgi:SAM-dependent methyltransferase
MMSKEERCRICGSDNVSFLFECTDNLVSFRQFPVIKCGGCGFRFTGKAPESPEISVYYESEKYISHTDSGEGVAGILYSVARAVMMRRKSSLVRMASQRKQGSVLDIGAGTGHFVGTMIKRGWRAEGIEVSGTARKVAKRIHGISLHEGLCEWLFPKESFDAVTMWHVLEHLHKPEEYLKIISSLLKPDGTLLIALPNPLSADANYYRKDWAGWDVPRHLWHFSPDSIKILVEREGFTLKGVKRLPFDAFYISTLSEKSRDSRFPLLRGLIKGALFYIISLAVKSKSSSLIYIFSKSA